MWGSNKNKIRSSKIDTLIGQGIVINGDVKFDGGLHLDGKIVGNAIAENGGNSVFIVSDKGRVEGDISVSFAIINGEVTGNVYASEKLELSGKARITGDVHYSLLEMASGAEVNGKMVHESEKKLLEHHVSEDVDDEHAQSAEPV
ncbi:MAG: polymer-forming cytoskeletal protein [Gammaproteobacteria bacterium]|nr:polymer-forming cytoskeletal protein [Gammaproteobacteria bacterium]